MSELDAAIPVEFPLRGEWSAVTTPAARIPSHGTDILAQRYAYDFVRLDDRRAFHPAGRLRTLAIGVPTRDCYGWGEPVHAAIDGDVVTASDGVPERGWIHPIRELVSVLWTGITYRPRKGFGALAGNHVIIRSGDLFHAYAHLATGSVAVRGGDAVRAGDRIGRVGHTGNSTAPHLHFQLMDGPDPVVASGRPASFRVLEVYRDGHWTNVTDAVPAVTDRIRSVA